MVFNFMSDGIPVVYYGQEQSFSGAADPVSHPANFPELHSHGRLTQMNREPLWPSGYKNTTTYQLITTLNKVRILIQVHPSNPEAMS